MTGSNPRRRRRAAVAATVAVVLLAAGTWVASAVQRVRVAARRTADM